MTEYYEKNFKKTFSTEQIRVLKEILKIIRTIFKESTGREVKLFLIGMKALYYYFGTEAFEPAPESLDIDINFDILLEWANYRKLIPQKIKDSLLSLSQKYRIPSSDQDITSFIDASRKATGDREQRITRVKVILKYIKKGLASEG